MKDLPYNMKNGKASWCAICEVKSHATADCHLNLNNRQNYQAFYQTNVVAQNNDNNQRSNDQNVAVMSAGSTTIVEDMEVEVDSLGIMTIDHVGPSNVLHAIKKVIDMQTSHTRKEPI